MDTPPETKKILVTEVITESWQLVNGLKWTFFWLSLLFLVIFASVFILESVLFEVFARGKDDELFIQLVMLPSGLFISFVFSVIFTMLGVRQSIGLPISVAKTISQCCENITQLFYVFLFIFITDSLLNFICSLPAKGGGLSIQLAILAIFYSLYISILQYVYLIPLVVTRKCPFMFALKYACKKSAAYSRSLLRCTLLMILIVLVSVIPLGIGLIWAFPMYCVMNGILFRETCGLKKINKPE